MPDSPLALLLDQNIPQPILPWLAKLKPEWDITHVNLSNLKGQPDDIIFNWAQVRNRIIVTFDEDFSDRRNFVLQKHAGIIRFKIWPTTTEETQTAFRRLIDQVPDEQLHGSLVIVGRLKIRIKPPHS